MRHGKVTIIAVTILLVAFFQNCTDELKGASASPLNPKGGLSSNSATPDTPTTPNIFQSSNCPARWICPVTPIFTSKIGAWFEPWWAGNPPPADTISWPAVSEYEPLFNGVGNYYDCGDTNDIIYEFGAIKAAGIDYLILDDTNTILDANADSTKPWIQSNIVTMFNVDAHLPAQQQIPMAVAIGGQLMLNHNILLQNEEANFVMANFAAWSSVYFKWMNLPLIINYNTFSLGADTYDPYWADASWRSTTRNAADFVNQAQNYFGEIANGPAHHGWWGWTQEYPQPLNSEAMTVMPGADNIHRVETGACSPTSCTYHYDRQNGMTYTLEWLRAIKQNPQTIVINSWNEFSDESAVESGWPNRSDAPLWSDSYGQETPDWYVQLTTGYTNLRTGLMPGWYYRDESNYSVYQVQNGSLVYQSQLPHGHPVIVMPAGTLNALLP